MDTADHALTGLALDLLAESDAPPPLTGIIETADPETGAAELLGYWLPPGVTPDGIGIARGIAAEAGDTP
jgi:hypothetical protein